MLTRLYVHNYKCLVNFEFRPQQVQLVTGANGSGKSTILDVLEMLRGFAVENQALPPGNSTRTRWLSDPEQRFEIEVAGNGGTYVYTIAADRFGDTGSAVREEHLLFNGKLVLRGSAGTLQSALPTGHGQEPIQWFWNWLSGIKTARVNPWAVSSNAQNPATNPKYDFSNLAGWYRYLLESDATRAARKQLLAAIREVIPGLEDISITPPNTGVRAVQASFRDRDGGLFQVGLDELSEGQRVMIALYLLIGNLHSGDLLLFDEPDNFVSLREIQPWLMAAMTAVEDADAQMIIASHHPELLNQLATGAVVLTRDDGGSTHIRPFKGGDSTLTPAELVARGWEGE
ncbi:MAG: AAA family ATPase [Terriglobales bacterium]